MVTLKWYHSTLCQDAHIAPCREKKSSFYDHMLIIAAMCFVYKEELGALLRAFGHFRKAPLPHYKVCGYTSSLVEDWYWKGEVARHTQE